MYDAAPVLIAPVPVDEADQADQAADDRRQHVLQQEGGSRAEGWGSFFVWLEGHFKVLKPPILMHMRRRRQDLHVLLVAQNPVLLR